MTIKKRIAKRWSRLDEDRSAHVVMGWCLDCPTRFNYPLTYPFKDDAARRRYWSERRDSLIARFGPVEKMIGWHDYEADDAQREAFNSSETPNAYATTDDE